MSFVVFSTVDSHTTRRRREPTSCSYDPTTAHQVSHTLLPTTRNSIRIPQQAPTTWSPSKNAVSRCPPLPHPLVPLGKRPPKGFRKTLGSNQVLGQCLLQLGRVPIVTPQTLAETCTQQPQEGGEDEGRDGLACRKANVQALGPERQGLVQEANQQARVFAVKRRVFVELSDGCV